MTKIFGPYWQRKSIALEIKEIFNKINTKKIVWAYWRRKIVPRNKRDFRSKIKMAESNMVEVCEVSLLKMELDKQNQRVISLQKDNMELKKKLSECEEFGDRLIHYLLTSANQQDQLEKELKDLKLLFLHMDIEKRKKQDELNEALQQVSATLQNLSLF